MAAAAGCLASRMRRNATVRRVHQFPHVGGLHHRVSFWARRQAGTDAQACRPATQRSLPLLHLGCWAPVRHLYMPAPRLLGSQLHLACCPALGRPASPSPAAPRVQSRLGCMPSARGSSFPTTRLWPGPAAPARAAASPPLPPQRCRRAGSCTRQGLGDWGGRKEYGCSNTPPEHALAGAKSIGLAWC